MMYMVYIDNKTLSTLIWSLFIFLQKRVDFYPSLRISQNKEILLRTFSPLEIKKKKKLVTLKRLFSNHQKIMKTHQMQIEIFYYCFCFH